MLRLIRRGKKGILQIVGTIGGERYRESTGTNSEPHAQVILAKRQSEILDRLTWGERRTSIFAEAVILYLNQGGEARFAGKLNDHFGHKRMSEITQAEVSKFAAEAYPNSGPQGINRQVYTPLISIFRCAHKAGMCELPSFTRPKIPRRRAVTFARDEYLAGLLPQCSHRLKAAILLITFSGARASEACRLEDPDVNWTTKTALLRETKNGVPRLVSLTDMTFEALIPLRGTVGPLLGFKSRFTLNQAIARACHRAALPVMTSHGLGRHAFAARLLRQGKTLKEVQEAGGWKSFRMVAEIYGHLERSSVDAAVRGADTELATILKSDGNVVRIQRPMKAKTTMSKYGPPANSRDKKD
jgi:integrase